MDKKMFIALAVLVMTVVGLSNTVYSDEPPATPPPSGGGSGSSVDVGVINLAASGVRGTIYTATSKNEWKVIPSGLYGSTELCWDEIGNGVGGTVFGSIFLVPAAAADTVCAPIAIATNLIGGGIKALFGLGGSDNQVTGPTTGEGPAGPTTNPPSSGEKEKLLMCTKGLYIENPVCAPAGSLVKDGCFCGTEYAMCSNPTFDGTCSSDCKKIECSAAPKAPDGDLCTGPDDCLVEINGEMVQGVCDLSYGTVNICMEGCGVCVFGSTTGEEPDPIVE